ncbi:TonB-dependent receptor [Rhodohalobacter mucosus]|uniref:TonB-dependent receptor n=1 Tax=Rhodohalobacter mucosus TaxID=2079485 RepID=A0A316TW25_9BACT|nr:TonB-dependent receptor [Rhodohalobacter mucosus]PWN08051.1 TonB-dependent receptor [Rhodohalobacter mucosus]
MKVFLSLYLVVGLTCLAHSQTITVTDQKTGEPLEGVVLMSVRSEAALITDARGEADISSLEGAETILIRSLGYKTRTLSFGQIEDMNYEVALEPSILNLDQLVVSATRWRQTSGNIPLKIVSVTPEELTLQNPQTAADLLNVTGKVFIQKSQQGGGSPMIRGFATNRLIYTIDGVRMNTAIFRGGNIQNVINLDPFAIENTEVLFGPGSVIYGSDAIGGVMSFQTLTPRLSPDDELLLTGKAETRFSSANNERTGHFDVSIGRKKWAAVTSFSSWDYDHLRQGSHGPDDYLKGFYPQRQDSLDVLIVQDDPLLQIPTAYSQINLMQKARYKPNETWDFQYGFHFSETSSYGRYDRHQRIREGTARYGEWKYGPQKWLMNNLSGRYTQSNAIFDQLSLRVAHQSFEESRISRNFNDDTRQRRIENVEAYSANLDFTKNTGTRNTIYYGIEYILNDVTSIGRNEFIFDSVIKPDSISSGPSRYPLSTWESLAAYANTEYRLSSRITFQGGLRYNRFMLESDFSNNADFYPFPFRTAEINNGALTGSIGAVYKPDERWVIRANAGTAFRSPNVDDVGKVFDSEQGTVVVPNPGLEAEYAYSFDLGIAKAFRGRAKLDVTGYYTILDNAMVRRDFEINGQDSIQYDGVLSRVQALQNAAVARVYGVQAGVEVRLYDGFNFLSDVNYQSGEEELDDGSISPSRHAAPLFGMSRLRYERNGLMLELNTIYQGKRAHEDLAVSEKGKEEIYALDENGNTYSPAWYTLNFKSMYRLSETFSMSAGIENMTDRRYRPYSSGLSGPGRNFVLSLRAEF